MALFRRKRSAQDLPDEVQQYYAAERRDRSWLAWLLAVGSLIAVVLLATGLFFGGRWIYRQITKDDTDKPVATEPVAQQPSPSPATPATPPASSTPPAAQSQPKPAPAPTPATPPAAQATPTPPATPKPTPAPSPAPSSNSNLSNTGPGDTIAIFAATTVAGTAVHYVYTRRKRAL